MASKKGVASTRNPVLKRAKLTHLTELKVRGGLTNRDAARMMGISPQTVDNWNREARKLGIVEEVSQRMAQELLPKAAQVYETILDADVDAMTEARTVKAHALKLSAAKSIAEGLGALGGIRSIKEKTTVNLEEYMRRREARNTLEGKKSSPSLPPADVIEGELVKAVEEIIGDDPQVESA